MRLLRRNIVQVAAKEAFRELDLLQIELNRIKKMLLNGHHDVQVESGIQLDVKEKPNGTRDRHS